MPSSKLVYLLRLSAISYSQFLWTHKKETYFEKLAPFPRRSLEPQPMAAKYNLPRKHSKRSIA